VFKIPTHILYKIYYGSDCVYLGRTNQPIANRLRGHFFKKPMHKVIEISKVTKIEICNLKTEADMYIYEIYYINKLKPTFNRDDKSFDEITVILPELEWKEYNPPRMKVWIQKVVEIDEADRIKKQKEKERFNKKQEARKSLKGEAYYEWLEANGY
jgi:hypothetical protein